jgi:hypothetical protein
MGRKFLKKGSKFERNWVEAKKKGRERDRKGGR